jgi:hypothetical protein
VLPNNPGVQEKRKIDCVADNAENAIGMYFCSGDIAKIDRNT